MNPLFFDLVLRGTLVSAVVLLLDLALGKRQHPQWRRLWWVLAAVAWLLPLRLPHSAVLAPVSMPRFFESVQASPAEGSTNGVSDTAPALSRGWPILGALWAAGVLTSLSVIVVRTIRTSRRWSRLRLCTEPELLGLLEDCKAAAGVTAPIGLVVTEDVSTPALLGWLRPRILLPSSLLTSVEREQLRGILLHELAHFRSADIPLQWLFSLALSLHWFNPVAYLAARRWTHYRELAADATALSWMPTSSQPAYGEALIAALRQTGPLSLPRGALALGESLEQLKTRITMIAHSYQRPRLTWLVAFVGLSLSAFIVLPRSIFAEGDASEQQAKAAAQPALDAWLKLIDRGDYAASWKVASAEFRAATTSEGWVRDCGKVRKPLGALITRSLLSSLYQTEIPQADGSKMKGQFILAQYDSSFEHLAAARETLVFAKDTDGEWRAAGYLINAR